MYKFKLIQAFQMKNKTMITNSRCVVGGRRIWNGVSVGTTALVTLGIDES